MYIGLRQISPATVEWLGNECLRGGVTRSGLARELSGREGWLTHDGRPSTVTGMRVLPLLAEELGLTLPEAAPRFASSNGRPAADDPGGAPVECALDALGGVRLEPLAEADRRAWESMMETHHPEGWRRAPGGQLRYWIVSGAQGRLGGLGFVPASCQLGPRDGAIGWSARARIANMGLVLNNHRFLIRPSVRVHGLASLALRLAAERVADDWQALYGVRPVLAYTLVGPDHAGTGYRAAGWERCPGLTSGRRSGIRRSVWTLPLQPDWRKVLQAEPERRLGHTGPLHRGGDWAEREYARSSHPDGRVRRRIAAMGAAWTRKLGAPVPELFPGRAEQEAAYRLLSNAGVTMDDILEPHLEATVERCRLEPVILAVQDTTTLNYGTLAATSGLDGLGGGGKGTDGILAHCGVALNGSGRPLGLFTLDADFRRRPDRDSTRWIDGLRRAGELAEACPDAKVVSVCDREGDFWALLREADRTGAALLVRASRSAKRRVALPDGDERCLWEHVAALEPVGHRRITVPERGGPKARKARVATLTLRCAELDIAAPRDAGDRRPLPVTVVSAIEENPPKRVAKGGEALHWMLLSNEGGDGMRTAETALRRYELRWRIEEYFRALKTGTRIKDRRLDAADDLRRCLAFDAITAFRVWDLQLLARESPDSPADRHVSPESGGAVVIHAAYERVIGQRAPPEPDMSVARYVTLVAGLAGFRPTKRQPLPGTQKLWQGLRILNVAETHARAIRARTERRRE